MSLLFLLFFFSYFLFILDVWTGIEKDKNISILKFSLLTFTNLYNTVVPRRAMLTLKKKTQKNPSSNIKYVVLFL